MKYGTIAVDRDIPFNTKFSFDCFGEKIFTATDRGNPKYIRVEGGVHYIDVCIERPKGMNDDEYLRYVNNMGRIQTKGKMYLD